MTNHNSLAGNYDVVIVGAGVVGSFAAAELARMGYKVCILEKNARPGMKSVCTGIISKECLDMIPQARAALLYEASSARIFSPAGKCIHVQRDKTQAFVLDRPSLDRLMAASARDAGADLYLSSRVTSVTRKDETVSINVDGTAVVTAQIVLIACGAGSSLTGVLRLGKVNDYAYGAQTELVVEGLDEVEVYSGTDIAPGFFAWLVPTGDDRAKVGLLCKNDPKIHLRNFLDRVARRGRINNTSEKVQYGMVPLQPLARTFGEHFLVVGDAAGQVKPTTGGGIFFGLICANLAVQTIDEVFKASDFSQKKFSAYQKRWHRQLKQELSIDYWAHRFYGSLSNRQIEHIFNIIDRHAIHESILASPDITFDWHSKVILDALKHRSLQKSLEKLGFASKSPP